MTHSQHDLIYRYCVRCGGELALKLVKAGDPERLVCGSCDFIQYLNPRVASGAIVRYEEKLVLLRRWRGRWCVVGRCWRVIRTWHDISEFIEFNTPAWPNIGDFYSVAHVGCPLLLWLTVNLTVPLVVTLNVAPLPPVLANDPVPLKLSVKTLFEKCDTAPPPVIQTRYTYPASIVDLCRSVLI